MNQLNETSGPSHKTRVARTELAERNLSIDRFRGVLVIMMVIGDYLSGIQWVPAFLKHAPDVGFTIADTVAPAFVFVIGLNYGTSFNRRFAHNPVAAYRHFIVRYLSLVGIGAIISIGSLVVGDTPGWGVLLSLGVAGLINLIFIRIPTWGRLVIGTIMLIGYQILLDASMLQSVLEGSHGGPFGAISWAALLVLSTAVADIWRKDQKHYLVAISTLTVAAIVSSVVVPVSKHRVSLSFVLLTLAISAAALLISELISQNYPDKRGFLCWWGENALALYILHLLILAVVVLPPIDWWYVNVPWSLALAQLVAILTFMTLLAIWMKRWRQNARSRKSR